MQSKSALTKLAPLLKKPSFTSSEARELGVSSANLAYYVKKDELLRIGHGVYRAIDAPTIEDFRWEDLVHTVAKIKQGVICLTTALAIYELTDETPRRHWIAIPNETSHQADAKTKIVRLRNIELGKMTIEFDGVSLPIFDRERTIVDAFRFLSKETAIKALRNGLRRQASSKISVSKLREYAKILHVKIEPYLLGVLSE